MSDPLEIIILCHDVTVRTVMLAEPGTLRREMGERAEFESSQIPYTPAGFFDLIVQYFLGHLDLLRTQAKAK